MIPRPAYERNDDNDDGWRDESNRMLAMAALRRPKVITANREKFKEQLLYAFGGKKLIDILLEDDAITLEFESGVRLRASNEQETRYISFLVVNNTILWNFTFFKETA